jgi:hypothetical protein
MEPKVEFEEDGFVFVRAYEDGKLVEYRTNSPHHKHPLLTDDLRHQALHYAERMQKQREIESGRAAAREREAEMQKARALDAQKKEKRRAKFEADFDRMFKSLCEKFPDVPDKDELVIDILGGLTHEESERAVRYAESLITNPIVR